MKAAGSHDTMSLNKEFIIQLFYDFAGHSIIYWCYISLATLY
jgi:hypothetical protein